MAGSRKVLAHGIIAGVIGATAVAVWFLVLDAIRGRILFTPAALGSTVFHGATSPAQVSMGAGTIVGYTLLHYAAFILVGLVAAAIFRASEESPPLVLGLVLLFVVSETLFVGLVALLASWLLGALVWWAVAIGNVIAAAAMAIYLWYSHPRLRRRLRGREVLDEAAGGVGRVPDRGEDATGEAHDGGDGHQEELVTGHPSAHSTRVAGRRGDRRAPGRRNLTARRGPP